jgi:hypothetical protein
VLLVFCENFSCSSIEALVFLCILAVVPRIGRLNVHIYMWQQKSAYELRQVKVQDMELEKSCGITLDYKSWFGI